jgi:hypothetical protein
LEWAVWFVTFRGERVLHVGRSTFIDGCRGLFYFGFTIPPWSLFCAILSLGANPAIPHMVGRGDCLVVYVLVGF